MSNESTTSVTSEVTAESIHKMLREHTEQEKIFPLDIDTVLIQKEGGAFLEVPLPVYIKSQEGFKSAKDEDIKQARILFYREQTASHHIFLIVLKRKKTYLQVNGGFDLSSKL